MNNKCKGNDCCTCVYGDEGLCNQCRGDNYGSQTEITCGGRCDNYIESGDLSFLLGEWITFHHGNTGMTENNIRRLYKVIDDWGKKEKKKLNDEIVTKIFKWQEKNGIVSICSMHRIPEVDCDICNAQLKSLRETGKTILEDKIKEFMKDKK